jgi:cellulase
VFFKIDEAGWYGGRNFATDVIAKTQQWSGVRIPRSLKPGAYLLRHEAIALHAAKDIGGAQL